MADEKESIERTREELLRQGVVVAIRMPTASSLVEACRAIVRGGLRVLELTLTTPGALDAIEVFAHEEGVLAGAGTVLTPQQVNDVAARGGRFVMSPVVDLPVLHEAQRLGLLVIPGAGSATEILAAHRAGAPLVKVFPSGALGGPEFLRAVRGPLPDIPLVPTSGPTAENLHEYLEAGAVAVGVGRDVLAPGRTLDAIEAASRRVREAVDAARGSG